MLTVGVPAYAIELSFVWQLIDGRYRCRQPFPGFRIFSSYKPIVDCSVLTENCNLHLNWASEMLLSSGACIRRRSKPRMGIDRDGYGGNGASYLIKELIELDKCLSIITFFGLL